MRGEVQTYANEERHISAKDASASIESALGENAEDSSNAAVLAFFASDGSGFKAPDELRA
jgi:hypothetical protein